MITNLDTKTLLIKAGSGGSGRISFALKKRQGSGGPDGGDGGKGGNIEIVGVRGMRSLARYRRILVIEADGGRPGGNNNKTGRNGKSKLIAVPLGTRVWDVTEDGNKLIVDLTRDGDSVIIAKGGAAGRGNRKFATPTNRAPFLAEDGEEGVQKTVFLEVRLLADVGIVGHPNAGKSTLLSRISAARPKIGAYPFTTLEPEFGVSEFNDLRITFLEVPGLIEDAYKGKGLGHEFLRHVERVRILVFLVDGMAREPHEDLKGVMREVTMYGKGLSEKPRLLAINKVDSPEAAELVDETKGLLAQVFGMPPIYVSAQNGNGIEGFLTEVAAILKRLPVEDLPDTIRTDSAQADEHQRNLVTVTREEGKFLVHHKMAERIAKGSNLGNWKASMQFHDLLGRLGIIRELEKSGVKEGDTVVVGTVELEWK